MRYPKNRLDLELRIREIIGAANIARESSRLHSSTLMPNHVYDRAIIDGVKKLIQNNYRRRVR